ncbi:MAG TPA: cupredoxin family copper-binding protein [Candidatus Saccharimonadales bacterium]|nr:cupredoxin family copper-binding protein [Candidatus Saccharimonadales bacterium]
MIILNSKLIIIVLVIVVVLGGAYLYMGKSYSPATTTDTNMPTQQTGTNQPAVATKSITISNFSFSPATITVKVGDKVTITNNDSAPHTVTADDGSFDSGTIQPGATGTVTLSKAGTFAYHCSIHPSMKGTVVVQ